jgi:hypothetical protein
MARVEPEAFADREVTRVFIAATIAEARRAEEVLTMTGVNYVVQVEPFGVTLFGSPRNGAAFYVDATQAAYCGSKLTAAGLGIGVLVGDEGGGGEDAPPIPPPIR